MPRRTPLADARTALARGDLEAARDALVEAWRARRTPELAGWVDVLEARQPSALSATLAKVVESRVAPSLANLKKLGKLDDPRLATWVLAALADPPFCSPTSGPFLEYLADTIARLEDPRLDDRLPAIREVLRARVTRKPIYTAVIAKLERAVKRRPPPPRQPAAQRARDAELVAELAAAMAATSAPQRATQVTYESLLAEVYARPDDDGPRLVLADFLLERGDPRGELITLQLARGRGGEPSARELELLAKHGKAWLGELAIVLRWGKSYSGTRFERGFLAVADFIFKIEKKLPLVARDPAWATVEELDGAAPTALLLEAPLRALRAVRLGAERCAALQDRVEPFPAATTVGLGRDVDPVPFALLERLFPARTRLELGALPRVADLPRLGVRELVIQLYTPFDELEQRRREHAAFVEALARTPPSIEHVAVQAPWAAYPGPAPEVFVPGAAGYVRAAQ